MKSLKDMQRNYIPVEVEELKEKDMQWFRDAKFGMFIHWGLYSLLGRGEWVMFNERMDVSEYAKLVDRFEAKEFDAKVWAKAAKAAGMKYMVLTTRHHDGFCLFNSKASSFNSVNSASKRDFVAEYVEACRSEGLKVGLYYSPMDWRFPGYFFPEMYMQSAMDMKRQCWEQIRELMTNYGKIDLLWFDGEWLAHGGIKFGGNGWYRDEDYGKSEYLRVNYFWESEKLINMIRQLQPGIMINNRGGWKGDFHVRERRIGSLRTDKPWDSNDCLAESWGWMPNMSILSQEQLIKNLVDIATKDGNYLLNVGPDGDGVIEEQQVKRLAQIGDWLEKYGESIYSTRGGPFLPESWGGTTYSSNIVYVHITNWAEETIQLPAIDNRIVSYKSLTSSSVTVNQTESGISIEIPVDQRDPFDTIVELRFEKAIQWEGVTAIEDDIYGLADGLQ